jgi:hypothetical protein
MCVSVAAQAHKHSPTPYQTKSKSEAISLQSVATLQVNKMITPFEVKSLLPGDTLYYWDKGSDNRPVRAKINGKIKLWVTRPDDFRIPMKHGLGNTFYIRPANAHHWFRHEENAAEQKHEPCMYCGGAHYANKCPHTVKSQLATLQQ